jgi:hypothetical protein
LYSPPHGDRIAEVIVNGVGGNPGPVTVQVYCTHSPCDDCARGLTGWPAYVQGRTKALLPQGAVAPQVTWEYYWREYWIPRNILPAAENAHLDTLNQNMHLMNPTWVITKLPQ